MGAKNVSLLGETYAFRQEAFRDKLLIQLRQFSLCVVVMPSKVTPQTPN